MYASVCEGEEHESGVGSADSEHERGNKGASGGEEREGVRDGGREGGIGRARERGCQSVMK